jgi:2-polyprenyl-3-methyl-5-hydroxy-6-metoxy-1,4-benzoquinol methylase
VKCSQAMRRIGRAVLARPRQLYARWIRREPVEVVKSNTKKAFDEFFSDDAFVRKEYLNDSRLAFYGSVADHCTRLIAGTADVIDVGCGTGHFLKALRERSAETLRLSGMDFSSIAVARARRLVPDADVREADVYDISWPADSFDLVVCMETLEHLRHPGAALDQLVRICRPGGAIVLTVPNGEEDDWDGHFQFWDPVDFRRFVGEHAVVHDLLDWTDEHGALVVIASKPPGATPRADPTDTEE